MATDAESEVQPGAGDDGDDDAALEKGRQENKGDEGDKGDKAEPGSGSPGLRQLMIAGLAPTLALLGVLVGVIVGIYRDGTAAERADKIRVAELVLPRYEAAVAAIFDLQYGIDDCIATTSAFYEVPEGDPSEAGLLEDSIRLCDVELYTKAEALDVALGQALLVSSEELQDAALEYGALNEEILAATSDWVFAQTPEEADQAEETLDTLSAESDAALDRMRLLVNEQQIFATGDE